MATDPNSARTGLPYTVIRIRAGDLNDPSIIHYGTGFFYGFRLGSTLIPAIISNKHVLCNKRWLEFDFARADESGIRIFGSPINVRILTGQLPIFEHPNSDVDLAALPLNPLIDIIKQKNLHPHTLLLSHENFPPPHIHPVLHASTTILMIGFPNGIMDEVNNLPVVRRDILATHYKADYLGQANFVVDVASFGGSSGSPVFAFFEHVLANERGDIGFLTEPMACLIGVLHSGPHMTAKGEIISAPIPTSHGTVRTDIMIHLGYCLKAFRLEELLPVIQSHIAAP
jgi:hypothetical protein